VGRWGIFRIRGRDVGDDLPDVADEVLGDSAAGRRWEEVRENAVEPPRIFLHDASV